MVQRWIYALLEGRSRNRGFKKTGNSFQKSDEFVIIENKARYFCKEELDILKKLIATTFLLFVLFACRERLHPVPDIPFNINIDINLPTYVGLQSIGGFAYVDNIGVKGVVVYRATLDEFVAFDRMSTADGGDTCDGLFINPENQLILLDPCTESQFLLIDGSLVQGPANWGLRGYRTFFNGSNILNIQN